MKDAVNGGQIENVVQTDIRVQPDDKLSIVVSSKDGKLSDIFNLPIVSHRVGGGEDLGINTSQYVSYYTVDPDGDIDFPVLGKIHIGGMRRNEVASYIKNRLTKEDLLKDPVVTMEYMNTVISVLGEVTAPGQFTINKDKITILEALGLAGDMTINGKRENVLVTRITNGKPQTYRLDLTDTQSLYSSPAFYLQQNDVVYVEPNDFRKRQATVNGNNVLSASFWVSVASLLTSIAVLVFK